jgi:drug/metabolite transporter (DMT)-like permease
VSQNKQQKGLMAALLTPMFMGMAPVFGKLALHTGFDPYTLAAIRTCLAALALWVVYLLFFRRFTFIFTAGLLGTVAVGVVNGLGSLLFYNGLYYLDNASLAQLLNMLYVIFAMLLTRIYGQQISLLSLLRALLALLAVYLLVGLGEVQGQVRWLGIGLMLGGAFMYALHVVLSQRVMFEMPAPTMTLYALTWMGLTVLIARLMLVGEMNVPSWLPEVSQGWWFVLGLTAVTALSRVTLFAGVRNLGTVQTILLNVAEIGVTLLVAFFWLGERMSGVQWGGVALLLVSVLLSRWDPKLYDAVYRPVPPRPALFGGLGLGEPLKPLRLRHRSPRSELPADLRQDERPG